MKIKQTNRRNVFIQQLRDLDIAIFFPKPCQTSLVMFRKLCKNKHGVDSVRIVFRWPCVLAFFGSFMRWGSKTYFTPFLFYSEEKCVWELNTSSSTLLISKIYLNNIEITKQKLQNRGIFNTIRDDKTFWSLDHDWMTWQTVRFWKQWKDNGTFSITNAI